MIRASFSRVVFRPRILAPARAICLAAFPHAAPAAFVADPVALYAEMKSAYDKGSTQGWSFRAQEYYFSAIVNAGRAYALQYPNDPAFAQLALLTVQTGSGIHYDPLVNHDAASWYVREAANWVLAHSEDPQALASAHALMAAVDAEDDPKVLAQRAYDDATANVATYPGDVDAKEQQLEAAWRAYQLTQDATWETRAFSLAAAPGFPLANLPTSWGPGFVKRARDDAAGTGPSSANAQLVVARLKKLGKLDEIAFTHSLPYDVYMGTLAPADEYFGRMGMSILGMENQLKHINYMLDYNYGNRESDETNFVLEAVFAMHKVYPRDRDLPKLLYDAYTTLMRMDDAQSRANAARVRAMLTVEYEDSPQAQTLLTGAAAN